MVADGFRKLSNVGFSYEQIKVLDDLINDNLKYKSEAIKREIWLGVLLGFIWFGSIILWAWILTH